MADTGTAVLNGAAPAPVRPGRVPDPDEAGRRGNLVVKDRVVERIAEAAAVRVPGVAPAGAGAIGTALGRGYPRVECDVAGGRVRAQVEVVGLWPTPAARLGAQVRAAVAADLRRLVGLRVDAVDVTIAKVVRATAAPHRRVQ